MYHFLIPLNSSFSVSIVLFVADPAVYLCVELNSCRFATFLFWSVFVPTCFRKCNHVCVCLSVFRVSLIAVVWLCLSVNLQFLISDSWTIRLWIGLCTFSVVWKIVSLLRKSYCCVCYVCFRKNNGHWRMCKFHVRVSEIKSKNRKKTISLI